MTNYKSVTDQVVEPSPMAGYYQFSRPEVQKMVPPTAKTILDVGCAAGRLGSELKAKLGAEVWGIENVPDMAKQARNVLDKVYSGDVNEIALTLPPNHFDAIIFADVLEHLPDPSVTLKRLLPTLTPNGKIIISIPNVRHWSVIKGLLEGQWEYEEAGLLDRTHLRFFTRASFEKLLYQVGLKPGYVGATRVNYPPVPNAIVSALHQEGLDISTLIQESQVYQWLFVAEPITPPKTTTSLTSIIILVYNQLHYTKLCLESIKQHTRRPHEIIIVDNASTDGTPEYLRRYKALNTNVRVIANAKNMGFSAGNNQGLALARGDYVVLLNNDTIVTQGWLKRMLVVFEQYPDVGIVGPVSDNVGGMQQVRQTGYQNIEEMHQFANQWAAGHAGQSAEFFRVIGFCLMARAAVINRIGGLDEQFGTGNFEDDDFCVRAAAAGFKTRIAQDVFIHHTGGQTFKGEKIDYAQSLERNWGIFKTKWDIPADLSYGDIYKIDLSTIEPSAVFIPLPVAADVRQYELAEAGTNPALEKMTGAKNDKGYHIHPAGKLSRGAVLDVGLKCTHSCRFCYYSYLDKSDDQFKGMRRAKFRTVAECKEILRLLKQNEFVNFDFTGGEPSLHPDIIELTRYAHQELDLKGRMITLGQFLMRKMKNCAHDKLIDDLLEAGLVNFLFSMHAADEALFKKITGESFEKQRQAMLYLDEKGFQFTTNTTVFEWNYKHLPELAQEIIKHNIYLHNFILMNAYYEWNQDGQAFGVQARYSAVYPWLREAVNILESNNVGVNIRYAPLCSIKGMEKNLVGVVGVRYDPYEWMNLAGHMGGDPEFCASVIPIKEGEVGDNLAYQDLNKQFPNGVKVSGSRGNTKFFSENCVDCRAKAVCDGIDANYLKIHGPDEFLPYWGEPQQAPLHADRYTYSIPFIVKTDQFADVKTVVAREFKRLNAQTVAQIPDGEAGLTSIIVLNLNGDTHIRSCIESIQEHTTAPYELIVVDNGSTDDSLSYLRTVSGLTLVENPQNAGAPYARNQALALAKGEYIVFLDNDVVVTEKWLQRFVDCARKNPSFGLLGPRSNSVSGPQFVEDARYTNQQELQSYAREFSAANNARFSLVGRLVLFCLFVRREVIRKIGGIDPAFGKWGFEDDDFCLRAQIGGYRLAIAGDVFIHHTGSQTARTAGLDYRALSRQNTEIFARKWGLKPATATVDELFIYPSGEISARPFDPALHIIPIPSKSEVTPLLYNPAKATGEPAAATRTAHIQVGFIRRDENMDAAPTVLASLKQHTPQLAEPFFWQDVAALNGQLDQAKYLVLLAPDIQVTEGWLNKLLAVARSDHTIAAVGPAANVAPSPQKVQASSPLVDSDLRQFAARLANQRGDTWAEVPYLGSFCLLLKSHHVRVVGGMNPDLPLAESLLELYRRLQQYGFKLACAQGVFIGHNELTEDEGATYGQALAFEQAANKVLAAGQAALQQGDFDAAIREFTQVTQQHPDLAAAHTALGAILLSLGQTEEATTPLRRAVELVPHVAGAHNQLGVALYRLGQPDAAEAAFRQAHQADPRNLDALLNLIDLYRAQQRFEEALNTVNMALKLDAEHVDIWVSFGLISLQLNDSEGVQKVRRQLENAPSNHPGVQEFFRLAGTNPDLPGSAK